MLFFFNTFVCMYITYIRTTTFTTTITIYYFGIINQSNESTFSILSNMAQHGENSPTLPSNRHHRFFLHFCTKSNIFCAYTTFYLSLQYSKKYITPRAFCPFPLVYNKLLSPKLNVHRRIFWGTKRSSGCSKL